MLTRLYIHNFRCFVNFELKLSARQLILGSNGTGKSSLLDAILWLRQFVTNSPAAQNIPLLNQRTRWLDQPRVTFELEARLVDDTFVYRLEIVPDRDGPLATVAVERLTCNGNPLIEFNSGAVRIYNDQFEQQASHEFDPHWSSLSTVLTKSGNQRLTRFKEWISNLYCFRLDPFSMTSRSDAESLFPNVNLSNIASWYRHLVQTDPEQSTGLFKSLAASVDGFRFLRLVEAGQGVRLLAAQFGRDRKLHEFFFNELSDGQRCLICLYTIQHFILSRGACVFIDEPENFVSLREIQPWLLATDDLIEVNGAQVVLISHHPEIINQWAPSDGVSLIREESGMVRAQPFQADQNAHLPAAELIARGWDS